VQVTPGTGSTPQYLDSLPAEAGNDDPIVSDSSRATTEYTGIPQVVMTSRG
jgi:hypothetical protein